MKSVFYYHDAYRREFGLADMMSSPKSEHTLFRVAVRCAVLAHISPTLDGEHSDMTPSLVRKVFPPIVTSLLRVEKDPTSGAYVTSAEEPVNRRQFGTFCTADFCQVTSMCTGTLMRSNIEGAVQRLLCDALTPEDKIFLAMLQTAAQEFSDKNASTTETLSEFVDRAYDHGLRAWLLLGKEGLEELPDFVGNTCRERRLMGHSGQLKNLPVYMKSPMFKSPTPLEPRLVGIGWDVGQMAIPRPYTWPSTWESPDSPFVFAHEFAIALGKPHHIFTRKL